MVDNKIFYLKILKKLHVNESSAKKEDVRRSEKRHKKMPEGRLELPQGFNSPTDFKSGASADSATRAL